ncbi:DMT family transporter [Ancylobacter sp. Lp-2]|uniref:DMT family transporter n=1 Tax=Ancylobacter sp. Lp-2 TaxID=2881339 RepID=UPI001E63B631|nr:DMT family transporter [Ancylobacter sp. Lp-2]
MNSGKGHGLWRGILFMLIASACASLLAILTAYTKFVPPAVVASAHIVLPVLIVALIADRSVWAGILAPSLRPALVRACFVAGGQILHVLALFEGQLAKVVLLHHISPLLFPLLAWAWLGERMGRLTVVGLLFGFTGLLIVLQPWEGASLALDFATIAALCSGVAATISKLLLYKIARTYDQSARTTFIQTFGLAAILSLPLAVYAILSPGETRVAHSAPEMSGEQLVIVVVAAFIAMAVVAIVDQLLTDRAYRLLPNAELIGPFMYMAVLFSMLFDWVFLDRVPGTPLIVGAGLVVVGATLAIKSAQDGLQRRVNVEDALE